jgi:hypothetical protein
MAKDKKPKVPGLERMRAKLEELRLGKQLDAAWNRFCENCRERLQDDREVWVNLQARHEDDDDPIRTYYCSRCISIDKSREKRPRS